MMATEQKIDIDATMMWLDKGDVNRLAELHGIGRRQASNIIGGKSRNYSFIKRLVEEAEKNMRLAERTEILRKNLTLIR